MNLPSARDSLRSRVAADVGGTLADIVAFDELSGESHFGQTLTAPAHLAEGIAHGVHKANPSSLVYPV